MYGLAIGAIGIVFEVLKALTWEKKRKQRKKYYNEEYLQSDDWKRKRYVVLKRDNWTCVHCGHRASQVHHKRYARRNIGKEPIEWLISVCGNCHQKEHIQKED
jgi:5-methylcytosine-specific restriction endonuclease McrA